jgi:hypothetical protein
MLSHPAIRVVLTSTSLTVALIAPFLSSSTRGISQTASPSYVLNCDGLGNTDIPSLNDNYALQWNDTALQAIRNTKPAPTVVARSLAMSNTAMYDAWSRYDAIADSTQPTNPPRRPKAEQTAENRNTAISYAAYRVLVDLFPSQKASFDAKMTDLNLDPNNVSTDVTTAAGMGNAVAQTLLNYRHNDGSNQLGTLASGAYTDYTGYAPVNPPLDTTLSADDPGNLATINTVVDPSRWQPLIVSDGKGGKKDCTSKICHTSLVFSNALRLRVRCSISVLHSPPIPAE